MARRKKTRVFVSYSRHDEALVRPLAGLLGVAAEDAVFLDVSSLEPGDLWDDKILGAVREASVFVLCWCCESGRSAFVAKEISAALAEGKKKLVPVLFCSAPLPAGMADRQWIDLRGKIVHACPKPHGAKRKEDSTTGNAQPRPAVPGGAFCQVQTGAGSDNAPPAGARPAPSAPASVRVRYLNEGKAQRGIGVPFRGAHAEPEPVAAHGPEKPSAWTRKIAGLASLLLSKLLRRGPRSFYDRKDDRQAEKLAATAASYFETLGRK